MKVSAVIMAGGKSSRMGTDKALLSFNDKTLLQHVISQVEACEVDQIVINRNTDDATHFYNSASKQPSSFIADLIPNKGPLSGIHAALQSNQTPTLFLPVDQPMLSIATINRLIRHGLNSSENCRYCLGDPLLKNGGRRSDDPKQPYFPLFVYDYRKALSILVRKLSEDTNGDKKYLSMQSFHKELGVNTVVHESSLEFINVNQQDDYEELLAQVGLNQ